MSEGHAERADRLPIVLLHGYSASERSFHKWRDALVARGYDATTIHLGDYVSLSNEITIKDIAEAFDRALREEAGLNKREPFDAIVHSTGGLVIREWLATYGSAHGLRRRRLKRVVGLAPATFGSPLAQHGQSWIGSIFKGSKHPGPDFLESGHRVLSGLELGSSYTWDLAHRDLLRGAAVYDETSASPYPFVLIGLKDYGRLKRAFLNDPGSDGTVRWAGAGLNTRKIDVDLTRKPGAKNDGRYKISPWHNVDVPLVLLPDHNHTTIVSEPDDLVDMVLEALAVEDALGYQAWIEKHSTMSSGRLAKVEKDRWQQFVVRVVDERGDPVPDYYLELAEGGKILKEFSLEAHAFKHDESFRCFHVNLSKLKPETRTALELRLDASSGTELVAYHGTGSDTFTREGRPLRRGNEGWDACIDLTGLLRNEEVKFFFPYTTTLVEIKINREPMPLTGPNDLLKFIRD